MRHIERLAVLDGGEPAVRVLLAVAELGRHGGLPPITTVVLHPEPEEEAWYTREADEAIRLGPQGLVPDRLVALLAEHRLDAVWVGRRIIDDLLGFTRRCERAGITVVGPGADALELVSDRLALRGVAEQVGVPVLPYAPEPLADPAEVARAAAALGFPVTLWDSRYSRRGAQRVADATDLPAASAVLAERHHRGLDGAAAFVERDPGPVRRVEVAVLADEAGTVWPLDVRDIGVQRHGHRVIIESGCAGLDAALVERVKAAAVRLTAAVGYRGAGGVQFAITPDDAFFLTGMDARTQADHALTDEVFGINVLALRLALAAGTLLTGPLPEADGYAVEAYLFARDPEQEFADSPGRLALLALPGGLGVRVDAGVRQGDLVGDGSPLIAMITAWGRSRPEALTRLRRALERTTVVISQGATDRSFLLAVLERDDLRAGGVDDRWLDDLVAAGRLTTPPDPVAVVGAAIEAYGQDQALAESTFHAGAARGRPVRPEPVGTTVQLSAHGTHYDLRVDRTGPTTYQVHEHRPEKDLRITVEVERVNDHERRLVVAGRRHRIVAVADSMGYRIEVDGRSHVVTREDGVTVRAGWPAFVVQLLVGVGDRVAVGDPVAVLETMKMESAVVSPVAGEVVGVTVVANAQVDAGAALVRVRADALAPGRHFLRPLPGPGAPADLATLVTTPTTGDAAQRSAAVYAALSSYLLGYDCDPATRRDLLTRQRRLPADRATEDAFLDLYADLAALYRPTTEQVDGEADPAGTEEYLNAYLQWLDPDRAGLPDAYRHRLERALARYGVVGWRRTPALESAVVRLFRSVGRVPELTGAVVVVLQRRLHDDAATGPGAGGNPGREGGPADRERNDRHERERLDRERHERERYDRLATAAQGRQQVVADLARDVRFHELDEPMLTASVAAQVGRMAAHLVALRQDPRRGDRLHRFAELVSCPQPLRATLLSAYTDTDDPSLRDVVLEVYARRFYRTRDLHDVRLLTIGGHQFVEANYELDERQVHLIASYTPFAQIPHTLRAVADLLRIVPAEREVVVDLATWRDGAQPPVEQTAAQVQEMLDGSVLGRSLHRVDVTVTSLDGPLPEHFRTQHVTFRQSGEPAGTGGFVEEPLYRNLHPMLAKRLGLWRLANFSLERLASPEDIYLFLGVARTNPKDRRLFALAEVRDLTPLHSPGGPGVPAEGRPAAHPSTHPSPSPARYPSLERMGLQALSALRGALADLGERDRPVANRVVLYVRPEWSVPRSSWDGLARAFAPLAAGAGLEKVVLRVRMPEGDGTLRDGVLHVEGIGGRGVVVREEPMGSAPVRPMDAYRQKVLLARRFGAPYPYEIARLLAPEPQTSGAFPPGRFQELDLDGDGALVPVDRQPGENSAHLVVGLLTSVTAAVPEGMTRVALLGDPTKGLGNLAEPECRRINAALDLAAARDLPVEWFAVSSGALIAMDSGSENMDWISATLRRIIEFTQAGGEINIVVTGINVGGQPYWNAEATMLMHTRGILVMTPTSAMVLTGKQALDFSGGVSAEDNLGIGGYDRVMGPNGQAQYWAPSFEDACRILMEHYEHTYVVPGERFPRRRPTADPADRDIRLSPHRTVPGSDFTRVGQIFEENPERKKPFDMRSVMRALTDVDATPLERWPSWRGADTSIVWDARVGGIPVCLIGLESRAVPRRGFVPADGPVRWTSGTLFPQSSRKTARAINSASGNRPLVVLANLSGFDGSPESMRRRQLEYGAEIGRAVTNFRGPIVFVVVSRYHGGAFVVFSKALNENLEIAAIEGSFASVIGGAPAAATVFAREVKIRTERDPRLVALRDQLATASGARASALRASASHLAEQIRSAKLGEVADEFDHIHTIERALRVGSVDRIITAEHTRAYVIDALERGIARCPG